MEKKIIKTAKELFEAEVKASGAKYIDEVADIHYYYLEGDNVAYLYSANEECESYDFAIFPKAKDFLKAHSFEFIKTLCDTTKDECGIIKSKDANKLFDVLTNDGEKDFETIYNFCYYCDFLESNMALAYDIHSFKDEYEEVEEEKPVTEEKSEVVKDIVQNLRDSLTAQKKVVWSFICNRFENDKKNIDMKRMPDAIADADGFQYSIQGDGDFFAIVIFGGITRILYRPEGDEEQETYFDWKDMSYEALLDILYAMA